MAPVSDALLSGYVPSLVLSIEGASHFLGLACLLWYRFYRQPKYRWMLPLCIGTTTMALGYIVRIPMTYQPGSLGIYLVQILLILLSPCFFLAQNYMILPRLATWLGSEDCLFLSSRKVVWIFLWSDYITFSLQGNGGGMAASKTAIVASIGYWITLVGLILQLISFGLFSILVIVFGRRVRTRTPQKWRVSTVPKDYEGKLMTFIAPILRDWRTMYYTLIWSCVFIMIRCIYRTAEYAQGQNGTLHTTEMYFYILDTLPIFLAVLPWAFVWPPAVLEGPPISPALNRFELESVDPLQYQTNPVGP